MKKKTLKTFFLNMKDRGVSRSLKNTEIVDMFNVVSSFSLDKSQTPNSRVIELDNNVYYMILDSDDSNIPKYNNCITGLFVKDREYNYPYESDGNCSLSELVLSNKGDTIAEVTYFEIDTSISTMLWISNRYVAGFSKMYTYINILLDLASSKLPRLDLITYSRTDADNRFLQASRVKSYIFKTTGKLEDLIPRTKSTLGRIREFENIDTEDVINYIEVKFSFVPDVNKKGIKAQKQIIRDVQKDFSLEKSEAVVIVDDQSQDINFLDDQFVLSEVIEINERYTNFKIIFSHLHSQLSEQRPKIIREYRS